MKALYHVKFTVLSAVLLALLLVEPQVAEDFQGKMILGIITFAFRSFVTRTTSGYGDIVPATPLTRNLAWMEAVAGQFYLAVLVAGLIGMRVSRGSPSRPPGET